MYPVGVSPKYISNPFLNSTTSPRIKSTIISCLHDHKGWFPNFYSHSHFYSLFKMKYVLVCLFGINFHTSGLKRNSTQKSFSNLSSTKQQGDPFEMESILTSLQWWPISTRLKSKFLTMAWICPQDLALPTFPPLSLAHCVLSTLAFLLLLLPQPLLFTPTPGPLHCWPPTWYSPFPPPMVNGCSSSSLYSQFNLTSPENLSEALTAAGIPSLLLSRHPLSFYS